MSIDVTWLLLATGVIVPILAGLATARAASPALKATVLVALAAIGGVLNELLSVGGQFGAMDWNGSLSNATAVFLIGVGLHFGLLKPVSLTGSDGIVQTGAFVGGLGGPRSPFDR